MTITSDSLSPYSLRMREELGINGTTSTTKLIATLRGKKRYVLHYEILKLYIRLGLELERVHRCVSFTQYSFLKPYITLNNKCRREATNAFDVALYKLYNNCVYGKTIYNVFKQIKVKLVNDTAKFSRLVAKPTFTSAYRIRDDMLSVAMKPLTLVCDKPIYVGATVLDLSKAHMYSFYYDYLVARYSSTGLRLLYTDTDSFYVYIQNRSDVYEDILANERFFDRSNYPKTHFLYSTARKRHLGLMKDEHACDPIVEMCALRSKMYSVRTVSSAEDHRAKGLRQFLLRRLTTSDYLQCLREAKTTSHRFKEIKSRHHRLRTVNTVKEGLSPYEDKRYVLSCGVCTLSYGHRSIGSGCADACCECVPETELV